MSPRTGNEEAEVRLSRIASQNEILKSQLMSNSLINELTKVLHTCTDLDGIVKTLLLGLQEILQFDRVILFSIDAEHFQVVPTSWVGVEAEHVRGLRIPLGFEGGELTDAIFLNRHLIVDSPDRRHDLFSTTLNSPGYLVIPLLSKATSKCYDYKSCTRTSCPAHGAFNPYCWSIPGAGEAQKAMSEDDRRRICITCDCFKCTGVFWLDRAKSELPITSDDITTLSTIINQAGIIIENFRIRNALQQANEELSTTNSKLTQVNKDLKLAQTKIQNDLDHARSIQQGLLPQALHAMSELSVGARYIPAQAVGGDYYDVFTIEPGVFGIIVADVSGHGVASALIMTMAKVLLKTVAVRERSPRKTLEIINETFLNEVSTDNFVTIFYAVLDTGRNALCFTSAGHCPVLFINKETGSVRSVGADGLFLGVFEDMMLKETVYEFEPGKERLVLYTDGLTEAQNAEETMFEIERLERIAVESTPLPPQKAVNRILEYQRSFCGPENLPEDDITLLVVDL